MIYNPLEVDRMVRIYNRGHSEYLKSVIEDIYELSLDEYFKDLCDLGEIGICDLFIEDGRILYGNGI